MGDLHIVGNFEGVISSQRTRTKIAQKHSKEILSSLGDLGSAEKIVLGCSNNHSGDFGEEEFNRSCQIIEEYGFQTFGQTSKPNIILEDLVNIAAVTFLANKPSNFVSSKKNIKQLLETGNLFNILFPHWGYELQLYPHPIQIDFAKKVLTKWDAIVGHHSHNPQPITAYEYENNNKLVAYSLGDFCFGLQSRIYHLNGIILKVSIGYNKNKELCIGDINWEFTQMHFPNKKEVTTNIVESYRFFDRKMKENK